MSNTSMIVLRRSTALADARARVSSEPVVVEDARVRVGTLHHPRPSYPPTVDALATVSGVKTGASITGVPRAVVGGLFTVAWGALSYALFAGKWIVKTQHPVWGVVTGFFSLSAATATVYSLSGDEKTEKVA